MSAFELTVHGMTWNGPVGQISIDHADDAHYADLIEKATLARAQMATIRERGWDGCAVCGDNGHHAGMCHHNPLMLAVLGGEALLGLLFKCFHCGAVFTDEESARNHFGKSPDEVARCLRDRFELTKADRKLISGWKSAIREDRKMGNDPDGASYGYEEGHILSRRQLARVVSLLTGKEVKP